MKPIDSAQADDAPERLAGLTGLSPAYVDRANLRIEHVRFFTELFTNGDNGISIKGRPSPLGLSLASPAAFYWAVLVVFVVVVVIVPLGLWREQRAMLLAREGRRFPGPGLGKADKISGAR